MTAKMKRRAFITPNVPMGTRARRQKRHNQGLYWRQLNLF
jgi:hypothetical protein